MGKAQSISINTIIIAAIGLAVLVILFAIFTGRLGSFSIGVQQTDTCAQKCDALSMDDSIVSAQSCTQNGGTVIAGRYQGVTEGTVCCCTP
jgi:hypothetical protein